MAEARPVPLLRRCSEPGCSSMTIGSWCIEHEPPRRLSVVISGDDAELTATACAAAANAWPDAHIVCDSSGAEPLELAFEHAPDVLVLARESASAEALASALVLDKGLPSVRVVVFASVPGEVLVPA